MSIKKILGGLHLWLGLFSGIVVFIVCITGCIWVFSEEITDYILEPESLIQQQDKTYKKPSELLDIVYRTTNIPRDFEPWGIHYRQGKSTIISLDDHKVQLNPYSGEVIQVQRHDQHFDFFEFILNGHRNLWLPQKIGHVIVNYATLIFVVLLGTGIYLWWPKNKAAAKQRYWFQWKNSTKWKRKNYDLHNIPGFYSMLLLLFIAITGMTFGLAWVRDGLHWTFTAGKETKMPERIRAQPLSDTLQTRYSANAGIDSVLVLLIQKLPDAKIIGIDWPDDHHPEWTIRSRITYPVQGTFKSDVYTFDRHNFKILATELYKDENLAGKAGRMYYDIHVGQILGLPGKILAFIASLIGATLPVTGFYIWWGRRKKEKPVKGKSKKVIG